MAPLLTVTGRDVLFAHWPVDRDVLADRLPAPLTPASFDGSGWVSVLALENDGVGPGPTAVSPPLRGTPQLNLRTYVTVDDGERRDGDANGRGNEHGNDGDDDDVGVYFLSLDTGRWAAAAAGRRAFGLPFHRATMRLTRRDDEVTFRSRRRKHEGTPAIFQARYRPTGTTFRADPGTLDAFCVEQFRYYVPASEAPRPSGVRPEQRGRVRVGSIDRESWTLQPVAATIRENTLFAAAGLPTPTADPVVGYSPGFEMGVERF
jgi:uncharacterized protein YqjF (DUF2071 family)